MVIFDHCMHVTVQSIQNFYKMNTSHNEHFLGGPNGVHLTEVLLYIENREDDFDLSSFEEKEKYERTCFGDTMGNSFFRVPQLNSASIKQMTANAKKMFYWMFIVVQQLMLRAFVRYYSR